MCVRVKENPQWYCMKLCSSSQFLIVTAESEAIGSNLKAFTTINDDNR